MGRNDRLGSGLGETKGKRGRKEARKSEEVAKDRVGRNDRLSQGGGGEQREEKCKQKLRQQGTEWAGMTD